MSEEVIAAIEAPRNTYRLIGHDAAQSELAGAWDQGRFHHAWLVSGIRGVGKATLAWAAARHVLAFGNGNGFRGGPIASTVGEFGTASDDPQAKLIASGGHPDCRLVRRSFDTKASPQRFRKLISVQDVRPLASFLNQTSALGGWRVAIVDAADDMSPSASNALLKMLEEPPARTVIFLISHAPQRLLATIRSRCRKLTVSALSESQVIEVITPLLPELRRDDLLLLARLSNGSPGRALELANAGGAEAYRNLMGVLSTLPDLDEGRALDLADKFSGARAGDDFITFTDLFLGWLARMVHDAALARQGVGRQQETEDAIIDDPSGEQGAIDTVETILNLRLATVAGLDRWLEVWDKARSLIDQSRTLNLDRHQVTMSIFFNLAATARNT